MIFSRSGSKIGVNGFLAFDELLISYVGQPITTITDKITTDPITTFEQTTSEITKEKTTNYVTAAETSEIMTALITNLTTNPCITQEKSTREEVTSEPMTLVYTCDFNDDNCNGVPSPSFGNSITSIIFNIFQYISTLTFVSLSDYTSVSK